MSRELHDFCGFKLTKHQQTVLDYFADPSFRDSGHTVYTVDEMGRVSYVFDTISGTERVMRALAKKGLFVVTTDTYRLPYWPERDLTREVFTLTPEVADWYAAQRRLRDSREKAREAERQARQNAEQAQREATNRALHARELAAADLMDNHAEEFAELLHRRTMQLEGSVPA